VAPVVAQVALLVPVARQAAAVRQAPAVQRVTAAATTLVPAKQTLATRADLPT
jgi:hypothetical protein